MFLQIQGDPIFQFGLTPPRLAQGASQRPSLVTDGASNPQLQASPKRKFGLTPP